jgi:hypothetical protein
MNDSEIQTIVKDGFAASWGRMVSVWASGEHVFCSPPRGPSPLALRLAKYLAAQALEVRDLLLQSVAKISKVR